MGSRGQAPGAGTGTKPLEAIRKDQNQHSEVPFLFLRIFFTVILIFFSAIRDFFLERHSHAPEDFKALVEDMNKCRGWCYGVVTLIATVHLSGVQHACIAYIF